MPQILGVAPEDRYWRKQPLWLRDNTLDSHSVHALMANPKERFVDRTEEILDDLFADRNDEIRAQCKIIARAAKRGLAIYESLAQKDELARKASWPGVPHEDFIGLEGLLWLMEFEIATLLDDYLRAKGERRWLYARLLFFTLFESTKTLRSVFSKGLRRDIALHLGEAAERQMNEMHRYIQVTFNDLNSVYGDVRNNVVGHRTVNAAIRTRLLGTLSPIDIKDLAWDVLNWCASWSIVQKRYLTALSAVATTKSANPDRAK